MNRITSALICVAMLGASAAYAAKDTQEATPLSGGKAQEHGETHKQQRQAKPAKKAASATTAAETGRGEGSGVVTPNASEKAGQSAAAKREAKPHKDSTQGSTPK
mgnify:CR=1 FL=1